MYTDDLEESLTEELIDIMMQDQSSTEKVKLATIAPQLPLENQVFSNRHFPCPSPIVFMPINECTEGMNYIKPDALSPHGQYHGTKYHMRNHLQQPEYLTPKFYVSTSAVRVSNSYASGISIKIEQEGSRENEVKSTKDSKETEKIKMGDRTKKSGRSSMSSLEATSFQKRLFGLHHSAAHNRKIYTLPLTSKATGSSSSSSSKTSNLRRLSEPPLSPATITNSPYPPPEPMELQCFEVYPIHRVCT